MEALDDSSSAYLERFDFSNSCETCDIIRSSLYQADPTHSASQDLGSLRDLLDVCCPGHDKLVREFYDFCHDQAQSGDKIPASRNSLQHREPGRLYLESEDNCIRLVTTDFFWTVCLAKREDVPGHKGLARALDRDWVDVSGAKRCKDLCLSRHGQDCDDPLRVGITSPAWLIDTQTGTLVPGDGVPVFVALSYRWGESKYLSTTMDNFEALQQVGSLYTPNTYASLAPIIQRAMHLVRAMGERYLWADTLCIVSGNDAEKEKELDKMGGIYASAVFTIIAADGDAETGLPGIEGYSPSRALQQNLIPFCGGETLVVTDAHIPISTEYDHRGWTFQEFILAKRRLIFRRNKLFWMCSRQHVAEEFDWGEDLGGTIYSGDEPMDAVLAGFQDFEYLRSVAIRYGTRNFTREEDALPGIRGLLTLLSRTFEGGFLYGLPEMIFDQALAWVPGDGEMRSRKASNGDGDGGDNASQGLPSWSWLGWHGRAVLPKHLGHEVIDDSREIETIIPTVEWYTSMSPHGPGRRIRSTWLESQERDITGTSTSLPGWTRQVYNPRSHRQLPPPPEGCGEFIYTHEAIPDRQFWYPTLMTGVNSSTPSFNPEQTPYISCETECASLFAHREWSRSGKRYARLVDRNGEDCGILQVHSSNRYEEIPDASADRELMPLLEIAAICKRRVVNLDIDADGMSTEDSDGYPSDEMDESEDLDVDEDTDESMDDYSTGRYEFVVLWIEWDNGVAYRRGIGWVLQVCWEGLPLRKTHLVLG